SDLLSLFRLLGLLNQWRQLFAIVIGADPLANFRCGQLPLRLADRLLAVLPLGLDPVQPRTFHRQSARQDANPTRLLGTPVVLADPAPHALTDVPGGVVPDQQQRRLAFGRQLRTDPGQKVLGALADRPTLHEPQQHPVRVRAQQPVATEGLGIGIVFVLLRLDQAQRFVVGPGVQVRRRQAAPPGLIQKAQHPVRMPLSQTDQSIPSFFFRAYAGSGLLIQCLARFQRMPRRLSAERMASPDSGRGVQPWVWHSSATRSKVHRLVGLPNRRGLWCNRSLSGAARSGPRSGRAEWGREDLGFRQSRPSRAKACRALRTVGGVQPRFWATCTAGRPSAACSRIWQRRAVNASRLRRPLRNRRRWPSVKRGTKSLGFIPHYSPTALFRKDLR